MMTRIRAWLAARKTPEGAARLAKQAELWLEDDTLNTALAVMRGKAIDQWTRSTTLEAREECWRSLQHINSFTAALRSLTVPNSVARASARRDLPTHPSKE